MQLKRPASRPRPNRANIPLQTRVRSGQYSYASDRLCVCDHTYGQHTAAGAHLCIAHEMPGGPTIECYCQSFRPARVKEI